MNQENRILELLETITSDISAIKDRMSGMENRMSGMESDISSIRNEMVTKDDLKESYKGIGEMFEKVYNEVLLMKDAVSDNKKVIMQNSYDINKLKMAK